MQCPFSLYCLALGDTNWGEDLRGGDAVPRMAKWGRLSRKEHISFPWRYIGPVNSSWSQVFLQPTIGRRTAGEPSQMNFFFNHPLLLSDFYILLLLLCSSGWRLIY